MPSNNVSHNESGLVLTFWDLFAVLYMVFTLTQWKSGFNMYKWVFGNLGQLCSSAALQG